MINNFSKSFLLKTISFQSFSHIHREHWSCAKKKKKPVSMTRVVGKGFCDVILHTCGTFAHTHARSFLLLLTPSLSIITHTHTQISYRYSYTPSPFQACMFPLTNHISNEKHQELSETSYTAHLKPPQEPSIKETER